MGMLTAARPSARVRRAANCTALWSFSDRALHQRALQKLLHVATRNPKAAEDGIYELGKAIPTIDQEMASVSTEGDKLPFDERDALAALLEQRAEYAPVSDEILGILKQMTEEMGQDLAEAGKEGLRSPP